SGIALELDRDDEHVTFRVGRDPEPQPIPGMDMGDLDGGDARRDEPQRIVGDPLDLDPEAAVVGDDEAEIADLRNIDARIIDFVDDAEAEREPQLRHADRAADHVFRAARPGWPSARMPGRIPYHVALLVAHRSNPQHPRTFKRHIPPGTGRGRSSL